MKSGLFLLLSLVLIAGCASQGPAETSSASPQEEPVYAQSSPATDMGSAGTNENEPDDATSVDPVDRERAYARELALEEEMIVPQPAPETESAPETVPETEPASEVEPVSPASSIDLYNTFTIQLVAMDSMDAAIAYARRYGIDPEQAGVARILSHGEIYYVLAYGIYSSHEQAEQASLELQQLGVPEPWIRRLGTLERLSMEADEFQPTE